MNPKSDKKSPKVVISGYYGFDNCGDEAVLLAIIHCLRTLRPDVRIVVLSGNPKKTRKLYSVEAVNRWNPIKLALQIISCRLVISGGGSLLQDVTSTKSLRYYTAIINFAAILGKRVMIYSQGIGPLNSEKNRIRVSRAINRCHTVSVRDERSAELLRELGVHRSIQEFCDPVVALSHDDVDYREIEEELRLYGSNRKPMMVAVRRWRDDRHLAPVAEFLDSQVKSGRDVLLVAAHYPEDMEAVDKVIGMMAEVPLRLDKCLTARQFLALSAHACMVFSMRLHGLICAFAVGTPILGLSYDPKVEAFMEQAGLGKYCMSFDSFSKDTAQRLAAELDIPPPQSTQEPRRQEMRNLAWRAAQKAAELLMRV